MTAAFIAPVVAIGAPSLTPLATAAGVGASPAGFGDLVSGGLRQIDGQLQAAQTDMHRLAAGDGANLHQLMIRLEEARLGFQLMLQVRSRLLESYQEVMRMQV